MIKSVGIDFAGTGKHKVLCLDERAQMCDGFSFQTAPDGLAKLEETQEYTEGLRERYKVERKFGEARKWHSFIRCRYTGFIRHAIQSYFTFMALNLKRLVKLLTGVSF